MVFKASVHRFLADAGIMVNGSHEHDIHVHDERFYRRVILGGSLALGESYMDGWWDVYDLAGFFDKLMQANAGQRFRLNLPLLLNTFKNRLLNLQARRPFEVAQKHYDLSNVFFEHMLDPRMVYTCARWNGVQSLAEAQEAKLDLVCRKIGLQKGDHVLDIGCGWGSFLTFAAERYGAQGTGVTVAKEQEAFIRERVQGHPIDVLFQDYADPIEQTFDHVVSIGMFEAVGYKNFNRFMRCVSRCLKDDGLFLLHTIGSKRTVHQAEPWTQKYIFPNGMLPSIQQIAKAVEGHFVIEHIENFGADYDKTLLAWFSNFDAAWQTTKDEIDLGTMSPERFYRMWKYYLLSCAGAFRARDLQLYQVVLSKRGVSGGYTAP